MLRNDRHPTRPWLTLLVAPLLAVLLSGCSNSSDDDPGTDADRGEMRDSGGLRFTEVAAEAGLTESHSELELSGEADMTSAAAVADVDGDGFLDIFLPRVGKPNGLYMNNGDGTFTDVARDAGVAGPTDRFGSAAAAFIDVDGDGHLDLFVSGAGRGRNELFMNNGDGTFTDEAAARGLSWPEVTEAEGDAHHHGVSVADVDGDGHLDLLVLQWYAPIYNGEAISAAAEEMGWDDTYAPGPCESAAGLAAVGFPTPTGTAPTRSALFLNDGNGNFTDRTDDFGLPLDEIVAFTGVFADFDGDGHQDLAITGDGCTSRLFRNVEGRRFEDVTEAAGVGTDENGMGAVVRDIDGDGRPDWFITSVAHPDGDDCQGGGFFGCSGNRLFLNETEPGEPIRFRDATDDYGLRDGAWGWGAAIEDLSNDGSLEVVMNNGYQIGDSSTGGFHAPFLEDTTRVWVLDDPDSIEYRDVAAAVGVDDTTIGHALIAFDMDNDGDLDLLVVPSGDEPPRLYRNDTPVSDGWITVSLDDPTTPGNRWGDGARIEVTQQEGDVPVVGWISTSGSYESQRPPVFHVGFGDRSEQIEQIAVHWPGSSSPQVIRDVDPGQQLRITRE